MIDYAALDSVVGQNWYDLDPGLQQRVVEDSPPEDLAWCVDKLRDFGHLCGTDIARNADIIDRNPPRLVRYDRWADEINEIEHHPATIDSKKKLWQTGYVSMFAADTAERGRTPPGVHFAAVNYLLSQADTGMVCSLGMTSGVAGLVAAYAPPDVRDGLLAQFRTDNFDDGIDGSMYLTERAGGSDLGRTIRCVARDIGDGRVLIDGEKWFCSNVDGGAIVLLARPDGASEGASSIGLYLVPKFLDDGTRNHFSIRRLKDKLGTKSVPTGEVEFHGALGYALRPHHGDGTTEYSDDGGLNRMMEMVNSSRFGVAMMGLGIARRSVHESLVWAHHREAKGRLLVDLPLAREQLVDQFVELEAAFALGFECTAASQQHDGARLRRILVPAAKVRLCRLGVEAAGYAVELVGGNGYCEDWGLTRLLRDAQCHPIWEGSENICMLDVQRAIRREAAHEAVLERIDTALDRAQSGPEWVASAIDVVRGSRDELATSIGSLDAVDADWAAAGAARLTQSLIQTTSAALLLERGAHDVREALVALRYVRKHLTSDSDGQDRIAFVAGREIVTYGEIEEKAAAEAAFVDHL